MHDQFVRYSSSKPPNIEVSPMKRNCPSDISVILRKVSRQMPGARKGKTPSSTSISAKAAIRLVFTDYTESGTLFA